MRARRRQSDRGRHGDAQDRTGQGKRGEKVVSRVAAGTVRGTLVAVSSAASSFSSALWNSSNTLSRSSSVTRNFFSISLISSSN